MPFSNNYSVIAADMNNMLRGLYRDNTDRSITGSLTETDLGSVSILGGTITATGGLHVISAGTITGVAGTKRMRLYLGATALIDTTALAGTSDWYLEAWIYNTASNAQRCSVIWSTNASTTNYNKDYITAAIDTASNQTLKVTGTLGNVGDTIAETMFDVMVIQIT